MEQNIHQYTSWLADYKEKHGIEKSISLGCLPLAMPWIVLMIGAYFFVPSVYTSAMAMWGSIVQQEAQRATVAHLRMMNA